MSPVRPTVQVIGRRLDPGDYALRDFLTRTAQPHEWYEAGSPEADRLLAAHGLVEHPELVSAPASAWIPEEAAAALATAIAHMPWPPQPERVSKTWMRSPPRPSSVRRFLACSAASQVPEILLEMWTETTSLPAASSGS